MSNVTRMLAQIACGDRRAAEEPLPLVRHQCAVRRPDQQLWLACGASLVTNEIGQALIAAGARRWTSFPAESPS